MTISMEKPTRVTGQARAVVEPGDELERVPVDQIPEPRKTAFDRITAHREGTKQPILVPWLRKADERTAILRWAVVTPGTSRCSTPSVSPRSTSGG